MTGDSSATRVDYDRLVQRIRALVGDVLPTDTEVLVVSRGDDRLLELPVHRATHFLQTAEGAYAGYHPRDSRECIKQVEELRQSGAQFLLIPSSSLWWLDYYTEFGQYLESRYAPVVLQRDTCLIFDLRTIAKPGVPTAEQLRQFLAQLCIDNDTGRKRWWREYWLDTGHVSRLAYMLYRVAPGINPRGSVLDVGSFGEWPLLLWKHFGVDQLYACSLEGGYLGYGEGSLKEHNEYPKEFELPIIKVDIESEPLPFENESLETITCFEVLEHLRLDPMYAISELNRVLKPSGRLILTTPNINSYDGMLRMLNGDTPCSFARYFPHRGGIGHAKEYSVKELGELLVYAGFTIDALETFNVHRGNRFERSNLQYTDLPQFLERRGWSEALAGQHILAIAERSSAPRVRYYYPLYTRTPETEQSGAG